jgi:hypothetical protein
VLFRWSRTGPSFDLTCGWGCSGVRASNASERCPTACVSVDFHSERTAGAKFKIPHATNTQPPDSPIRRVAFKLSNIRKMTCASVLMRIQNPTSASRNRPTSAPSASKGKERSDQNHAENNYAVPASAWVGRNPEHLDATPRPLSASSKRKVFFSSEEIIKVKRDERRFRVFWSCGWFAV